MGATISYHLDSSLTTKVRPIFDALLKDENGNSLNACLEKGPNLIEMLPKHLIQFRQHAIGVTADIREAFLQIICVPETETFLKFLWWKDSNKTEIVTYRHCRVVFGISSSPFLLGATISYHLDNAPQDLRGTALREGGLLHHSKIEA
ncbi:uncharacterized protein LOC118190535 [Stegodyphus dumicola]|uniref:uncharacterized protein LOC118190535 n=1 Tax=Stegodyphus dumicola TaxID=202533 RepID=UPI0015A7A161|nr:uncharacterized protein LOC118190535 [Stegodyphus dumicola]